jgi:site-specific DNA-methyltransferase (adenine-specific)
MKRSRKNTKQQENETYASKQDARVTKIDTSPQTILDIFTRTEVKNGAVGEGYTNAKLSSFKVFFNEFCRTPQIIKLLMAQEIPLVEEIDANSGNIISKLKLETKSEWSDGTFLIVDYSDVEGWLRKAVLEHKKGKNVVVMCPARTNTIWFHKYILEVSCEVRFLKGRMQMSSGKRSNPAPDCVIIYSKERIRKRRKRSAFEFLNIGSTMTENDLVNVPEEILKRVNESFSKNTDDEHNDLSSEEEDEVPLEELYSKENVMKRSINVKDYDSDSSKSCYSFGDDVPDKIPDSEDDEESLI